MNDRNSKQIFFISQGIKDLNINNLTGAAQKYELQLEKEFSAWYQVKILSYGLPFGSVIKSDNMELVGTDTGLGGKFRKFEDLYNCLKKVPANSLCIFWTYDLCNSITIHKVQKENHLICIPILYDDHHAAVDALNFKARLFFNFYFFLGIKTLKWFDGYILFQNAAIQELGLKKKCCISKPGIILSKKPEHIKSPNGKFVITYAGTLRELNGIDILLKSFVQIDDDRMELAIYGNGPLQNMVENYAKRYPRIHYYGLATQAEIEDAYKHSSLNVCLRALDDYAMKFAFPSKLFECMATGTPTLTTKLLNDEDFSSSVILVNDLSVKSVRAEIEKAVKNPVLCKKTGIAGRSFIEKHYTMSKMAGIMNEYISQLYTERIES